MYPLAGVKWSVDFEELFGRQSHSMVLARINQIILVNQLFEIIFKAISDTENQEKESSNWIIKVLYLFNAFYSPFLAGWRPLCIKHTGLVGVVRYFYGARRFYFLFISDIRTN